MRLEAEVAVWRTAFNNFRTLLHLTPQQKERTANRSPPNNTMNTMMMIKPQGSKFGTIRHGNSDDFMSGVEQRLMPFDKTKGTVLQQIEFEHRQFGSEKFTPKNYPIETTTLKEFELVTGICTQESLEDLKKKSLEKFGVVRRIPDQKQITELMQQHDISFEETIALILYTGPMFAVYNAVLEKFPDDLAEKFRDGFNVTIRVIIMAIGKLSSMKSKKMKSETLHRGTGGYLPLPSHFFEKIDGQNKGFTIFGFISTTSDIGTALQYSGVYKGRPHPAVLQIERSEVSPGADVQEFSQYPHERETIFPPYSYFEPVLSDSGDLAHFFQEKVPVYRMRITPPQYRAPLLPSCDVHISCKPQKSCALREFSEQKAARCFGMEKFLKKADAPGIVLNVWVDVSISLNNALTVNSLASCLGYLHPSKKLESEASRIAAYCELGHTKNTTAQRHKAMAHSALTAILIKRFFEAKYRDGVVLTTANSNAPKLVLHVHSKEAIRTKAVMSTA